MTEKSTEEHWQSVYQTRATDAVSWYQPRPDRSLAMIAATGVAKDAAIADIGGGASTLADHLLADGFTDLTVLDVSAAALDAAKARLGEKAGQVTWITGDIQTWRPERQFAVWHDRAVFHFLTAQADREAYVTTLTHALAPDGHVVMATFSPQGPEKCSGLPVMRHDASSLASALGGEFLLIEHHHEDHATPGGAKQNFIWCRFRRT